MPVTEIQLFSSCYLKVAMSENSLLFAYYFKKQSILLTCHFGKDQANNGLFYNMQALYDFDSRRSRPKIVLNIVTSSVKMQGTIIIMRFCCLLLPSTQDPCQGISKNAAPLIKQKGNTRTIKSKNCLVYGSLKKVKSSTKENILV